MVRTRKQSFPGGLAVFRPTGQPGSGPALRRHI